MSSVLATTVCLEKIAPRGPGTVLLMRHLKCPCSLLGRILLLTHQLGNSVSQSCLLEIMAHGQPHTPTSTEKALRLQRAVDNCSVGSLLCIEQGTRQNDYCGPKATTSIWSPMLPGSPQIASVVHLCLVPRD